MMRPIVEAIGHICILAQDYSAAISGYVDRR